MLYVKNIIQSSLIPGAGLGLFTTEFISVNSLVWQWDDRIDRRILKNEINNFSNLIQEFLSTYAYSDEKYLYLCSDNARFFNHSSNPNVVAHEIGNPSNLTVNFALRDIQPGEELTIDYKEFDQDWEYGLNQNT